MGDQYPKYKVAAVQAEPVLLDREASTSKACSLIQEAAKNGAKIIALPEGFIPGHPEWFYFMPGGEGLAKFQVPLFSNSVEVPSPTTERLAEAAKNADVYVAIGINERVPGSMGSLYNSILFLGPNGKLLGVHRKLVPTTTERLVYAPGDGTSLRVYPTPFGELGGLMCGENTNSLARFTLLAQGEKIHTAHWCSFPTKFNRAGLDGIDIRVRYHAYEGKIFVLSSSAIFGKDSMEKICDTKERRELVTGGGGVSGVINPYGKYIGGPLVDEEGIVYADVDLSQTIQAKTLHDVVGHYNRFDVLSILYKKRTPKPIIFDEETAEISSNMNQSLPYANPFSYAESTNTPSNRELKQKLQTLIHKIENEQENQKSCKEELLELKTIVDNL